jgi:hypothetical protein
MLQYEMNAQLTNRILTVQDLNLGSSECEGVLTNLHTVPVMVKIQVFWVVILC